MTIRRPTRFTAFTIIWLGQLLSALGTRMTNFALGIWVYQATGRATDLALLTFFAFGATVVCSPLAGALIDRWNRRLTVVLSDAGSALATLLALGLFLTGSVSIWKLFVVNALTGGFLAFQLPAYSATISLMMEKGDYPRANAMLSVVRFGPAIFAPTLAAGLLVAADIKTILLIDELTYLVAIVAVFLVTVPQTPTEKRTESPSMWRDSVAGFRYIAGRGPLMGLEAVLFAIGMLAAIGYTMIIPLILARTGSEAQAGIALSIGAIGGVGGAVLIGVLKPTKDKMRRILLAIVMFSVVGRVLFGIGGTLVMWSIAMFVLHGCIPFIDGYSQAIWQEKVEPAVQGRVFAARQFIENFALPVGMLTAGPLADHVFEPQMAAGQPLASAFGWLVETGRGGGMGLLCVLVGALGVLVAAVGFAVPSVRRVERLIPDHDAAAYAGETVVEGAREEAMATEPGPVTG